MIIAHKIALDPNNRQATYFARACGTTRFAYNWARAEWQKQYKARKEDPSLPAPSEASLRKHPRFKKKSVHDSFRADNSPDKNHPNAVETRGQRMNEFRRPLDYKAEMRGTRIVVADRWFPSSKTCSDCGYIMPVLLLSVRDWTYPACGAVHDRDHNAAMNLKQMAESSADCCPPDQLHAG